MTDNRREIKIGWTCSDGKMFPSEHDAQCHQDKLNLAEQIKQDLRKVFTESLIPRADNKKAISPVVETFIVENSDTLFSILAKYYKTVDHDEEERARS
jgi:hypothetical protein